MVSENTRNGNRDRGMGVGYVTLIMLFAVICLTVLAALSYQAARANDKLNEKSASFTHSFYDADIKAKELLSQLDETALTCHNSGFFEDSFQMYCEEYDNLTVRKVPEGTAVAFVYPVSDNLELSAEIVFFSTPQNDKRYRIEKWKTVAVSEETDGTLGVWTGESLT